MPSQTSTILLGKLQHGLPLSIGERVSLALQLALPSILSQLTTIMMQYVDASMVGHLGAEASAAIGLVSTTTWLMGGLCSSLGAGFAVLVSHRLGARDEQQARAVFRQAITFSLLVSGVIGLVGLIIAPWLPSWLGGGEDITHNATLYFSIFAATIPIWEISFLMSGMLRSAGNMRVPAAVNIAVCILNVAFNYLFIYVLELGVLGAALGTACAMTLSAMTLTAYAVCRSEQLHLTRRQESSGFAIKWDTFHDAMHIGVPMAVEHLAMCLAHIISTVIVAPLGTVAIAANSFGITIEGFCYMPGYGIGDSATTLVGQSIGAKRPSMQRSFGYLTLALGVGFMTLAGIVMYVGIPYLMPLMTPDTAVQALTVDALRIEAFAEPMYAVSIVAYAIFVGAGDTLMPCLMNLGSIWLVRLPLAMVLVKTMGLSGFWTAMAIELCVRGLIFLVRLVMKSRKLKSNILDQ